MHYSFPPEVELALISLKIFHNWRDIVGETGEFRRTGFVRIVHPGESELLKQNVAMQRGLGAKVELIDRLQLKELEPTGKWMKWNWPRMSRIRDMATATLSPTIS